VKHGIVIISFNIFQQILTEKKKVPSLPPNCIYHFLEKENTQNKINKMLHQTNLLSSMFSDICLSMLIIKNKWKEYSPLNNPRQSHVGDNTRQTCNETQLRHTVGYSLNKSEILVEKCRHLAIKSSKYGHHLLIIILVNIPQPESLASTP